MINLLLSGVFARSTSRLSHTKNLHARRYSHCLALQDETKLATDACFEYGQLSSPKATACAEELVLSHAEAVFFCVQDVGGAAPERFAPLRLCCAAGAEHGVCRAPRRRHAVYLHVLMVQQQLSSMLLKGVSEKYIWAGCCCTCGQERFTRQGNPCIPVHGWQ